jgi:hypothetical protein
MRTVGLLFKQEKAVDNVQKPVDNTGNAHVEPTRAELFAKAKELGLQVKATIKTAELKELIEGAEKVTELEPEGDE